MQMKKSNIVFAILVWALASSASPIPNETRINKTSVSKDSDVPVASNDMDTDVFQKIEENILDIFDLPSDSEDPDSDVPY
ncbi:hypothetical protein PIROE2DRAFT_67924 [Piromyces sp. E2]|nr:hypothetical protein PIROE2DRAFT_67924 [Piromyces sp. E2]|eukprot:OUM56134.1 hypothetical protein PIROE2DRAFT_67924 [Piromyces sp. E2]